MQKNRLEAFSDGVLAIIITIMVLELKIPHGVGFEDIYPLYPVFLAYVLSFVYLAIYWNNHHHLLHAAQNVNAKILWANTHLLFWLSLVPFATGWMGENNFASLPMALYGFVMVMAAFAYWILQNCIVSTLGKNSSVAKAIGKDVKGKASLVLYFASIIAAFYSPLVAGLIFVFVALMWLVPDKRIERALKQD